MLGLNHLFDPRRILLAPHNGKLSDKFNLKTPVPLEGGGFIGTAMVIGLKREIYWVRSDDLKHPESSMSDADELIVGNLKKVS